MAELNRITFRGYFIHKGGMKTYKFLSVIDNELDKTFINLIENEGDNTILTVYGPDVFIKKFSSFGELMSFWKKNLPSLKNKECSTYVNLKGIKMRIAEINAPIMDLMELTQQTDYDKETFEKKLKNN